MLTEKNLEIVVDVEADPAEGKLRRYKSNWLRHTKRMNNKCIPKIMLNYR